MQESMQILIVKAVAKVQKSPNLNDWAFKLLEKYSNIQAIA